MPSFDVLVVGELNVDIILSGLEGLPALGQERIAREMLYTLGSSSAIFAHNLARLGARVAFVGKVGDDSHGRYLVDVLRSGGVDTSGVIVDPSTATGLTVSLSLPSDRAFVTYPGAMERFTSADIAPSLLKRARHLHVSSYYLQPALRPGLALLFQSARNLGLTTSLDPGHDPADRWDGIWDVLPLVDLFLPNEDEALRIAGCDRLEAAGPRLAERASLVVVKRGTDGAVAWRGAAGAAMAETTTKTETETEGEIETEAETGTEADIETETGTGTGTRTWTGAQTGTATATAPATGSEPRHDEKNAAAISATRATWASAGPETRAATGTTNGPCDGRGSEGCVGAGSGSTISRGYALDVDTIDSTGAGDSFNAGFIRMWLLGRPLRECLDFATACGAIACTYLGGTPGFPDEDGVRRFMELHRSARRNPPADSPGC